MYKITINNEKEYAIAFNDDSYLTGTIEGKVFHVDLIHPKTGSFHVIKDNRSYNVEIVKADMETKAFTISINGTSYHLQVKDKFDELLKQMGFDNYNTGKVNDVKAPMPGLVLEIKVTEGQSVKKGDPLVVLEAMKMENILKSPTEGIIKKIQVKKGTAVEKNQVLIVF